MELDMFTHKPTFYIHNDLENNILSHRKEVNILRQMESTLKPKFELATLYYSTYILRSIMWHTLTCTLE